MKNIIFFLSFCVICFSSANAQKKNTKISMTVTRNGVAQTYDLYSFAYNYNKLGTRLSSLEDMPVSVNVDVEKINDFLLKAVGGDSTNRINILFKLYNSKGEPQKTIELKKAAIVGMSVSISSEENIYYNSLQIYSDNLTVDGIEL